VTNPADTPALGTPVPDDSDADLRAAMLKQRADRLRFLGFAPLTIPQLAREFVERALLAPDAPALEAAGLAAVETVAGMLLDAIPANVVFEGLEMKVIDAALRAILAEFMAKARRDQAPSA
jgi:hypothetical protein